MINKSQITSFKSNGYVILKGYLSKNKIKNLKKVIEIISKKYDIKNIFSSQKNSFWKKKFQTT